VGPRASMGLFWRRGNSLSCGVRQELHNKNNNTDIIFNQNIKGLYNKVVELVNFWTTESPHILRLTEHHLCNHEINSTCICYYNLGVRYCRKNHKGGGVSIFVIIT
jgi:hypothetical protein